MGVEKLFQSFEVPESLKSKLLLPYLSDKAKSLLLRLDLPKQEKYSEVKAFLLNEFKLTPMQFKERFDRAIRNKDETCTLFCSRLKNLLTYYCNSRQVKESFKTLFSLLISDKIKSTLPEACLDHVLTAEGDTWLECDALANTIDIYFANHTIEGRPRFARSDFRNRTGNAHEHVNKVGNANNTVTGERGASGVSEAKGVKTGNPSQLVNKSGLCFTCHSPGHKQVNCPMRNKTSDSRTGDARVAARNFACAVETPKCGNETRQSLQQPSQLNDAGDLHRSSRLNDNGVRSQVWYNNRTNHTGQSSEGNATRIAQAGYTPPSDRNNVQPVAVAQSTSMATHVTANDTTLHSARTILSDRDDICTQDLITNGLSKLN